MILDVICLILVVFDTISIPFKYVHDRHPRPAWKRNYALTFAGISAVANILLIVLLVMSIRGNL